MFVGRNRYNACPTFGLRVRFFQQGCLLKKPCVQHSCVYVHMYFYFYFLFPPKMLHKFYRSKALNEVKALEEPWLRTKDVRTWMGNFFQKCRSESGLTLASLLCGVLYFLTFSPNPNPPPPVAPFGPQEPQYPPFSAMLHLGLMLHEKDCKLLILPRGRTTFLVLFPWIQNLFKEQSGT